MDNFFDNLCRTLATPMSRGRALKIIAGGLAGAVLAPFSFGQKKTCKPACVCSGAQQGGGCCSPGQTCWGNQICCSAGYVGASVVKQNKTQEDVVASKPTSEWDAKVTGATPMTADRFVGQLYQELKVTGGR